MTFKQFMKAVSITDRFFYQFESFGVKIGLECNSKDLLDKIVAGLFETFPAGLFKEFSGETGHNFLVEFHKGFYKFSKIGDFEIEPSENEVNFIRYFLRRVRLTVAEFAVGKAFLHAGAIGWKNNVFIFPGDSFSGKSTLIAEFLKKGAVYFSDEYAVIDADGKNHPFPKTISMRGIIDEYQQVELPPRHFTKKVAEERQSVNAIFFLIYDKNALCKPKRLSQGKGVLELLKHSVSIRSNPKFTIEVLNKISNRAIIAKSRRGEAEKAVDILLEYVEKEGARLNWPLII